MMGLVGVVSPVAFLLETNVWSDCNTVSKGVKCLLCFKRTNLTLELSSAEVDSKMHEKGGRRLWEGKVCSSPRDKTSACHRTGAQKS